MLVRRRRSWDLPEGAATPEAVYRDRRRLLKTMGLAGLAAAAPAALALAGCGGDEEAAVAHPPDPTADLYPAPRNARFAVARALTDEALATGYNNFYEFGSHKNIKRAAQALKIRPWTVRIEGLVETPRTVDVDTLIRRMKLEERLYRHRCVEAWSMTVPWTGFPLAALVDFARPLAAAKYVVFETFLDKEMAPGQRQGWYPWPYVEGLTMAEAANALAFVATGLYGKPIARQNGAPLRLVVPWKYGFKSIKSIVRITFSAKRPKTFWETIAPSEYGFWANVNPAVPHPRWSQARERVLGTGRKVPSRIYNGYGEDVADLYKGLEGERLFA